MKIKKESCLLDIRKTNPSKVYAARVLQDDENKDQALKDAIKMLETASKRSNVTVVIAQT